MIQEVILQTRQALLAADYSLVEAHPPVEEFLLADDISITQLEHAVAEKVIECFDPRWFGWPQPVNTSPQLYAFVRTNRIGADLSAWNPDQTLAQCVVLSRLVHPTSIPLSLHARIKCDADGKLIELIPLKEGTAYSGAWISDRRERDWLTEDDCKRLKELVAHLPLSVPERLKRALWYFEMAARSFFAHVRWTLIATGLEALIHTDRERSGLQFRTRIAKLAGFLEITSFDVEAARNFYDLRSQVSHGQGFGALSETESVLYCSAEDVLRGILSRSIMDPKLAATFADRDTILRMWAP